MLFLKRRVISSLFFFFFFFKKKRAAINMEKHAEEKKENKHTHVSSIYYSQEWPFLNKAIIFSYYGLYSLCL
jgi:hypothetical protein